MITQFFLREVHFYGVQGIIHEGAYFRDFIAFEKLKFQSFCYRFKVYAVDYKLKLKTLIIFQSPVFKY